MMRVTVKMKWWSAAFRISEFRKHKLSVKMRKQIKK
jgi:hypothetical protein